MIGWSLRRLKYLVAVNSRSLPEQTPSDLGIRYLDIGAVGRGALVAEPEVTTFGSAPSRARRLVAGGDTVVSTVRTYLRAVWRVSGDTDGLVVSTGFVVLSPGPLLDSRYLGWVAQSDPVIEEVVARSVGVSYPGINGLEIGDIRIPVPPLREQRSIANYLDTETARIDIALDLRRRTITLLDEKTIAVLDAAFASASTRRTKLKHLLAQSPCYGVLVPNFVDAGVPFVRVGDLTSMGSEDAPARYLSESQSTEYARTRLAFGDILLSVVGSIDKVRLVSSALVGSNIARAVCRLVPMAGVPSDLLALWFRTTAYLHQARQATSSDTAQPTLGMGDLADFEVWFPEPNAYDECRTRLQQKLDSLAAARNSLQRQVDLVVERRQALITAAVTGQLATSGVAA